MEEIDIASIKKRSIHGVFALVSRTFIVQIISFAVNFLLTIFLSPSVFGVFFVVSAVIAFFSYFSDIGLAAALIQKKESITENDLKTTFTIQQILVLAVVIIALLFSSSIGKFYNLHQSGVFLFQALIIAFFLSSLKTIPSVILERDLQFQKLVIPQIVETLFFNVTVLFFAIKGFGISSFTYAVLARGVSGVLTIYIIAPWRIKIGISKDVAKKLLSFGIPFQANSFIALIKDDLLIVYLGKILPLTELGYIGFAQKWAFMPLRLVMDNIIRITFPSFSRLQHEKNLLGIAIEKSLFVTSFFVFPALTGLVVLSPYFINLIPKYGKWEPALFSLAFFALNASLSSVSTPLTNALNAIGKIRVTLYLMIFWTIATWVLTPLFILSFGFNGVALASAIIASSVIGVIYLTKKYISFGIFKVVTIPFLSTIIMGVAVYFSSQMVVKNLISLIFMVLAGGLLYMGTMLVLARSEIMSNVKMVRQNLRR